MGRLDLIYTALTKSPHFRHNATGAKQFTESIETHSLSLKRKLELKTLKLAKEKRIKMRKKGYEEEFYKENPYFRCQKIYQVVKYQFK